MGAAEGAFTGEESSPAANSQAGAVTNNSMDQSHVTIMNSNGGHQVHVSIHYHHHGQHPEGLNCVFCSSSVITVVHVLRTASLLPQGKVSYTWLQVIPWSGCERKHINPYLYFLFGIHTPTSWMSSLTVGVSVAIMKDKGQEASKVICIYSPIQRWDYKCKLP